MAKSPLSAAHGDHGDHHEYDSSHHAHPQSMYIATALKLAALMALTIAAAQVDIGHIIAKNEQWGYYINNVIALGIAAVKTYLVVMMFMHVKWTSSVGKMFALMGFFFLIPLFSTWTDYWFRQHEPVVSWYNNDYKESALPRKIGDHDALPTPDPTETNTQNRIPKSMW